MTPLQIHDLLMSMVLANSTTPDSALICAIMAYSSLHRHGLNEEAMKLKIQAIRFLSTTAQDGQMSLLHAAQHIATSMILGSSEVRTAYSFEFEIPLTIFIEFTSI